ncbi:fusicoccadiene C-8 hydroxylase [Stipitochalara longipes BDJ]|nr:fusicoccadiene C-8 hydroxylase [Stipitochalara longipes BDJ]
MPPFLNPSHWFQDTYHLAAIIALGTLSYVLGLVIYRIFFHPLANFPGPKIAAATYWYECCWDIFGNGSYFRQIVKMHAKYGPIVRINPNELVVQDPEFFSTLYVPGVVRRTNFHPGLAGGMDLDRAHPYTVDHDHHRQRRKALEPSFTWLGVSQIQPILSERVATLIGLLKEKRNTNSVIILSHALFAFAGDVVTRIIFKNPSWSFLEEPNFSPDLFDLFYAMIRYSPTLDGFPWIASVTQWIPKWALYRFYRPGRLVREWKEMSRLSVLKEMQAKNVPESLPHTEDQQASHTLFQRLLSSDLPESEVTMDRIVCEAQILVLTGTVSVARSLDHLIVHILSDPEIHSKLSEELREAVKKNSNEQLTAHALQQLPYLQACIKEGLRLSTAALHRLPRVSPDTELFYKDWVIPRGTPVGMQFFEMHLDPEVYPEPSKFQPDRWLGDVTPQMIRNWVPFAKGSRDCLASALAHAEISMVLAAIFGPNGVDLKLYETDASDVKPIHGFVVGLPKLDTKGVRVIVE